MIGIEGLREEKERIKKEMRERLIGYLTAALGLVAGLAWNDAIKAMIEYFLPFNRNAVGAKFIYAVILTVVVAVLAMYLTRFAKRGG